MTDEQLRKIYYPVAESWKLIRELCDATGAPVECFKVQERAQMIFEEYVDSIQKINAIALQGIQEELRRFPVK